MRITREEWLASGQRIPGPHGVAMDYAVAAFRLLEGTHFEPEAVVVDGAAGDAYVWPVCDDEFWSVGAAAILDEFWMPELFPVNVETRFARMPE